MDFFVCIFLLVMYYDFNISVKREVSDGDYVDSVMRIEFIPILPTTSGKLQTCEIAIKFVVLNINSCFICCICVFMSLLLCIENFSLA